MYQKLCLLLCLSTLAAACATAGTSERPEEEPDSGADPDLPDAQSTPDAPATPDAPPPCTGVVKEILLNPGFDSGPGVAWEQDSDYMVIADANALPGDPHSGGYAAWMGGYNNLAESLWQDVYVPAGAENLEISGYRRVQSNELGSGIRDRVTVTLRAMTGAVLETAASFSNADKGTAWGPFAFAPTGAYAGQTIRLQIDSATDDAYVTHFFFDTLSVQVTVCQ
jgi:hypothetical protein